MKQLKEFIIEKFRINSKNVYKKQNLEEILNQLEDNFENETKLKLKYIMFQIVENRDKTKEWIQLSSGAYHDNRIDVIINYIKNKLKEMKIKDYKISTNKSKSFSEGFMIINIYINN